MRTLPTSHPARKIALAATLATGLMLHTGAATLAAPAQTPLFLSTSAEPNVMFILDDSGSMQFEVMPDDYTFWGNDNGYVIYVYPRADGVYGANDYSYNYAGVATVDDNNAYNALMRSPQVNRIYYNPAVTYKPWTKYDSSQYSNASTTCALHNPERSGTGAAYCRDLTANNSNYNSNAWHSCDSSGTCTSTTDNKTFWPATYFYYNGGGIWAWGNYTKVEIKSSTASYTGHGRGARTDCADAATATCTYAEEIQNFANWYTYYRSRILTARAGTGQAFAAQGSSIRVGFGTINKAASSVDGLDTSTIISGVRTFSGTDKQSFFTSLYTRDIPAAGTPLRKALNDAGQYYSRSASSRSPWDTTPGDSSDTTNELSCRQSYTILMTDGYWSGGDSYQAATSDARNNNDGTGGPTVTGPNSLTYTYSAVSPFTDSRSNTLADVAMYYWKRDLRSDVINQVPTTTLDPAFWQHMVTFGVGLGVSGSIVADDAFDAIDTGASITWPDPETNTTTCTGATCAARLDDLLHAAVNSRGDFFSAQDTTEFSEALSSALDDISSRGGSVSSLASNSSKLSTDTFVYQSRFDAKDWSGHLIALPVQANGTTGSQSWDAASQIPTPYTTRNIVTWNGSSAGATFAWASLTSAQQTAIGSETTLNYLRGDRSQERPTGSLRKRSSVLGDIINSDPYFDGTQNFGYGALAGTEGSTYFDFRDDKVSRTKMLYVGANDGMLHGFRASDGVELLAYVPNAVIPNMASLASTSYSHKYFVDGSPFVGDAYLSSTWKSILVGSTGAGGKAVFALDVTDPGAFAASKVLWEFTHANLGYTIGQPVIARLNDGRWAAVFGNGYESGNGTTTSYAKLFIVYLDANLSDGWTLNTDYVVIDTNTTGSNGLSTPALYDSNGDFIVDYAYAGDLQGNLWKFDLTNSTNTQWTVKNKSGSTSIPLFKARNASNQVQPITAPLEIGAGPSGQSGIMIYFGTGQYIYADPGGTPAIQSLYGIWDNFANNNDISYTCSGSSCTRGTILQQQLIQFEGTDPGNAVDARTASQKQVRVTSANTVDYTSNSPKRGWYMDLVPPSGTAQGERVISVPLLRHGRVIFTTILPSTDPCKFGGDSWLMELAATTGARLDYSAFDLDDNSLFNPFDYVTVTIGGQTITVPISSMRATDGGIFDTPVVISAGEIEYKLSSGTTKVSGGTEAAINVIKEKSGGSATGRVSWRQLVND